MKDCTICDQHVRFALGVRFRHFVVVGDNLFQETKLGAADPDDNAVLRGVKGYQNIFPDSATMFI